MGDIGSDTEAAKQMLVEAYIELQRKNPDHELLRLIRVHSDQRGFTLSRQFRSRCVRPSDDYRVYGFTRLNSALRDAAKGLSYKLLDTSPACEF